MLHSTQIQRILHEKTGLMFANGILKQIEEELLEVVTAKMDVIVEELKQVMQLTRRKIVQVQELDYVLSKLAEES